MRSDHRTTSAPMARRPAGEPRRRACHVTSASSGYQTPHRRLHAAILASVGGGGRRTKRVGQPRAVERSYGDRAARSAGAAQPRSCGRLGTPPYAVWLDAGSGQEGPHLRRAASR